MRKSLFAVAAVMMVVAGCYTPVSRLNAVAEKHVRPGSPQAEVERRFGAPKLLAAGTNGSVARYSYSEFILTRESGLHEKRFTPGKLLIQSLSVLYDTTGVVTKKLQDESLTDIRQEIGWVEVGPSLNDPMLENALVQFGNIDQFIRHLGEPMQRYLDTSGRVVLIWFHIRDRDDRPMQSKCRVLEVTLEEDRVINRKLSDSDMQEWFWAVHSLGTARAFSAQTQNPNQPSIYRNGEWRIR